ncbi:MAG: FIST signal transduction protein [Solirubrobacteraceae bacterium]
MSVRAGAGISTHTDPRQAGAQAAGMAAAALHGAPVELAVVFASGANLSTPEAMLEGVHTAVGPRTLIGCGAAGVLASGRELESGSAVAVWTASFAGDGKDGEDGVVTPFHATVTDDGLEHRLDGLPPLAGASGAIMLADPYAFPTDGVLSELASEAPTVSVLGGLASARTDQGSAALFLGEKVCEEGAVGVRLDGIEMLPCVSQGAAPLGREVTITAAEGNVIHELAGRPALETVERIIAELGPRERALIMAGVLIGLVIDGGQPEYEQGDFLVRGVIGAEPKSGRLMVGAAVAPGQVLRLHARDAKSADDDLRRALRLRLEAMSGRPPAGALVFSCNGRGRAMFGTANHDVSLVAQELGDTPTAGFFAAGEIGPVGGRSFLHGFTATIAVFPGAP